MSETRRPWPRVGRLTGTSRAAVGAELMRRFHAFVAEQLRHRGHRRPSGGVESRPSGGVVWQRVDSLSHGCYRAGG